MFENLKSHGAEPWDFLFANEANEVRLIFVEFCSIRSLPRCSEACQKSRQGIKTGKDRLVGNGH